MTGRFGADDAFDVSGRRGRILTRLKQCVRDYPGTKSVRYERTGTGGDVQVVAAFDLRVFLGGGLDLESAALYVNWWTHPGGDADWFTFHYTDSTGYDCGWHRQENDHVDGLDHFQERDSAAEEYSYEPVAFEQQNPIGIFWEAMAGKLEPHLEARYR